MSHLIYWFRNDLRLLDSPALISACRQATTLTPVYIQRPSNEASHWGWPRTSPLRQAQLTRALSALDTQLQALGSRLIILEGPASSTLAHLVQTTHAQGIVCETIAAPDEQAQVDELRGLGIPVQEYWQSTMLDIQALPFSTKAMPDVFTAFRHAIEKAKRSARMPVAAPTSLPPLPSTLSLSASTQRILGDERDTALEASSQRMDVSEENGLTHLKQYFSGTHAHTYKLTRNQLFGENFSTKFSPWLAHGTLSAPTIVQHLKHYESLHGANESTYWIWFELLWRDYFRFLHLKYGRQLYARNGLRSIGAPQPLDQTTLLTSTAAKAAFNRWAQGETKNDLVNAGMNELRATGWLSNRMRQIVASYLIYDLKLDWRAGAAWFEAQLIDYDVYSNQGNWLYIAGLGTDPRGGRRVNLEKQASEHDPEGLYRTKWGEA